ncbi:MAG: 3-phosphoshikimate 1-carboxyvinyltransferase [Chloroflexi bacterium]|nr:3-phosphoshikimate 1-carboxyvinyltransferase [Chloroflexota bacterium]
MNLTVYPGKPLKGIVEDALPGDKSISHRVALLAALATGVSHIENFQVSGVTRPMLQSLRALGVSWQLQGKTLIVDGKGVSGLKNPSFPIDCGNSATTLRLLTGAIAGAGVAATLDGTPGLRRRPMGRIVEPLLAMGVNITSDPAGTAPLTLQERAKNNPLHSLQFSLTVASAQVKSCLLLAALGAAGKTVLCEPGPSRDHTERILASMGVQVFSHQEKTPQGVNYWIEITPPVPLVLSPLQMSLPADPSAASFLIVAALITPGSCLSIKGICLNPTRTGLLETLQSMGGDIKIKNQHLTAGEPVGDLVVNYSKLHGTDISGTLVVRMIDEFPILAVAAAIAEGSTVVHDAAELRLKESDRIAVLAAELRVLGVAIEEYSDGFTIHGGKLSGGRVHSHEDHRLAMSLAVAGLVAQSFVTVQNAECTAESFPNFAETLQTLGANLVSQEG